MGCSDSGKVTCDKVSPEDCVRTNCWHWKTNWFGGNKCKAWCPACTGNSAATEKNQAYLKERVYYNKKDPNGYYEEGTQCTLTAIDNKWGFNRASRATVVINVNGKPAKPFKIKTTKLLSEREYHHAIEEGWYNTPTVIRSGSLERVVSGRSPSTSSSNRSMQRLGSLIRAQSRQNSNRDNGPRIPLPRRNSNPP